MNGTFVPSIGHLTIQRTYLTVNEPMLFSARNEMRDLYFVSYADMTENGEAWIATRVSEERLSQYERGKVDTRDMFLKAETGTIVYVEYDDTRPERPIMRDLLLTDAELLEYLPQPGRRIPQPVVAQPKEVLLGYFTETSVARTAQPVADRGAITVTFDYPAREKVTGKYHHA